MVKLVFLKLIPGYEDYYISKYGEVYSKKSGLLKLVRPGHIKKRYLIVNLNNRERKSYRLHRLVAMTWIPNPSDLPEVNHKDGNTKNNKAKNLEWVTRKENQKHRRSILEQKGFVKSVVQSSLDGSYIQKFESIVAAGKSTGINSRTICAVCNGQGRSAGGFLWCFENDYKGDSLALHKASKKVVQFDLEGKYVRTFESVKQAAEETGCLYNNISACCHGRCKTSNGYIWKFAMSSTPLVQKIDETTNWEVLPDYPLYKISEDGRVYSSWVKRMLKSSEKDGYLFYSLTDSFGTAKSIGAHRLVARAYLPNLKNLPWVNHKDGNPLNNHVKNLEWCTKSENAQHAHDTKLNKSGKTIVQLSKDGEEIDRFINVATACRKLNKDRGMIDDVLKGRRKYAHGYAWKYA